MLFAGVSNRLEIKKFVEEFLGRYTEKEAMEILEYAFEGSQYNFLYINKKGKIYKNFNPLKVNKE